MRTYRRWSINFLAGSTFILAILAWIFFAPAAAGGAVNYVIINGNSMEPLFHTGDLVIVRAAHSYQVGDIVTYQDPRLDQFVIHRIIATDSNHYTLKGDNNDWVDSYQPTMNDLIGKKWIHLPGAGKVVLWVRRPVPMAILVGGLGGIFMVPEFYVNFRKSQKKQYTPDFLTKIQQWSAIQITSLISTWKKFINQAENLLQKKINRFKQEKQSQPKPDPDHSSKNIFGLVEGITFILGLIFFASLVGAVFSFTKPGTRTIQEEIPYKQSGIFSYQASAPAGVYDSETIHTGEPLFPKLTCQVNFAFDYLFESDQIQNLNGKQSISAIVLEQSTGWQREIPLSPPTSFTGNAFSANNTLDICQVIAMTENFETLTEIHPHHYSLIISPEIQTNGYVAGTILTDTFSPQMVFQFDRLHFSVVTDDTETSPMLPEQEGMVQIPRVESNTLDLFGQSFQVYKVRELSIAGLVLSILTVGVMTWYFSTLSRQSQAAMIRVRYGSMLVDTNEKEPGQSIPEIEVSAIEDLAKLAERNNGVILHYADDTDHDYLVHADHTVYKFTLSDIENSPVILSSGQSKKELLKAIERKELKVYYQPIFNLTNRKIIGVEALLRWQHPLNGLVSANEFIYIAEKTGLIDKIGEWMLLEACQQLKTWQEAGVKLQLAVNFSQRQLEHDPDRVIRNALQRSGLDPSRLQIEVLEKSAIKNQEKIRHGLQEINKLGIHIALDDYSGNLPINSYDSLPIDTLKIDRKMLENVTNPSEAKNMNSMISYALEQGINVIAEGVETEEQLSFLSSNLCPQAQGYLLGRPAPADELTELFKQQIRLYECEQW